MRQFLTSLLFFSALSHTYAQTPAVIDSSTDMLSTYPSITVKLDDPRKHQTNKSYFHHFTVLDERPDTLRIGAHTGAGLFGKGRRQLVFAGHASRELANYLDANFSNPSSPYTALVVIRALWVSDGTFTLADFSKDTSVLKIRTRIRLKAEIYAEKEGKYTPLFRFDSTGQRRIHYDQSIGQHLAGILNDLADSAMIVFDKKGSTGRKLSLDEIRQFNRSRFDPLIYRDSVLVSGVYRDFQEFKDNSPSIQDFETVAEKGRLLLYVREKGKGLYYTHDAWGYCDGKTVFVMKDGLLVPSWQEGRAFYLLGQPEEDGLGMPGATSSSSSFMMPATTSSSSGFMMPATTVPVYGGGGVGAWLLGVDDSGKAPPRKAKLKHIFTIDMDTGKLY